MDYVSNSKSGNVKICAICGKRIAGKYSRDHVFPRAIYKWTEEYLSDKEQKALVDSISSKDNVVYTHEECNFGKEDSLPVVENLKVSPSKRLKILSVQKEIQVYIDSFESNKQLLLEKQKGLCPGCGKSLDMGVIRRKDPDLPRTWENACVVCHECNLEKERF